MNDVKNMERLSALMGSKGVDVLVIGPSSDLEYLTGLTFHPDERFKALFVFADGSCFSVLPELYYEEGRAALGAGADIYAWGDSEGFLSAVLKGDARYGLKGKTIGINDGVRAVDLLDMESAVAARYVNGSPVTEELRLLKTGDERNKLREAARLADEVMGKVISFIRPGLTEKEIRNKIEALFLEAGCGLAFEPIVASGPNTSRPHYNGSSRVVQERDVIILDFGCRYKGFCSDISRTVFVGEPTAEQREVFAIVAKANGAGEAAVMPGVTAEEVDLAARNIIREAGCGQFFLNRTGHGVGIAVHEGPYIREGNRQVLEDGMCFSVEPGIYMAGRFGMRVEDIVLVTGTGKEVLNKYSRDIIII